MRKILVFPLFSPPRHQPLGKVIQGNKRQRLSHGFDESIDSEVESIRIRMCESCLRFARRELHRSFFFLLETFFFFILKTEEQPINSNLIFFY